MLFNMRAVTAPYEQSGPDAEALSVRTRSATGLSMKITFEIAHLQRSRGRTLFLLGRYDLIAVIRSVVGRLDNVDPHFVHGIIDWRCVTFHERMQRRVVENVPMHETVPQFKFCCKWQNLRV
jgi:hypothetical protein